MKATSNKTYDLSEVRKDQEMVKDKDRALKLIRELNEWALDAGAELRIDEDGNLIAVVELR
ncbi:hypothetical protein UFOVP235_61 [uncultured Caudovirales phage]|uniref:Uncharacterized protein n=1 Tax=uncultured Caudovirales phage TaxID=2100421 RepID=A0A6J7WRR3_9CAUD|nr:hypothetical protein UFOVP235_61 [uncultured Caudovirales phage]